MISWDCLFRNNCHYFKELFMLSMVRCRFSGWLSKNDQMIGDYCGCVQSVVTSFYPGFLLTYLDPDPPYEHAS